MDLSRVCYTRRLRFVNGDPSQVAVATWYRAAPTAEVFPVPHAFGSAIWDTVHKQFYPIGDDDTVRFKWYNGRRVNSSDGSTFAGPLSFFINGADAPAFLPRLVDGTPTECGSFPFGLLFGGSSVDCSAGNGGLLMGGICTGSSGGTVIIPECPNPISTSLTLIVSSVTCSCMSGSYPLTFDPLDTVAGLAPAGAWRSGIVAVCGGSFEFHFFDNGGGQLELYLLNALNQGCGAFMFVSTCSPFDVNGSQIMSPLCSAYLGVAGCTGTINYHVG